MKLKITSSPVLLLLNCLLIVEQASQTPSPSRKRSFCFSFGIRSAPFSSFFHLVSSSIPSSCATLWCHLFSDVTKQKVSSHTIFRAVLESFFLFEQFQFYNMGLSRTLFVYFYSFSLHNSITNWKCVDIVLGIRTQGRRKMAPLSYGCTIPNLSFETKNLHVAGYPTRMTLIKVIFVAVP